MAPSELVFYEHPLNERIRIFLRLEFFFSEVAYFIQSGRFWESQVSLQAFIEILNILDRNDIRSEVLKELERQSSALGRLLHSATGDTSHIPPIVDELSQQVKLLQGLTGKLSPIIRASELLTSIRHRSAISGGTCGFDIPSYHHWLHLAEASKAEQLLEWFNEFAPLRASILLVLKIIRESGKEFQKIYQGGLFYHSLDAQSPTQMVRLGLPLETGVYPEISGNRHRINIRLMAYDPKERPKQISHNLGFSLSCCGI